MARVPQSFQHIPGPGQVTPFLESFPVANAQTFVNGDLVYMTAGDLALCGTDPTAILGIAREDNPASAAGTRRLVEIIMPGQQYAANLQLAADTFVESTTSMTAGDLERTTAGNWEVDLTGNTPGTTERVRVFDTLEKTPDGRTAPTLGGPVKVVFIDAYLQWGTRV